MTERTVEVKLSEKQMYALEGIADAIIDSIEDDDDVPRADRNALKALSFALSEAIYELEAESANQDFCDGCNCSCGE